MSSLILQTVKGLTMPAEISQTQSYLPKGLWDGGCSPLFLPWFPQYFSLTEKKKKIHEVDESDCDLSFFSF